MFNFESQWRQFESWFSYLLFVFLFQSNTNAKVKLLDLDSYISFEKVGENFLLKAQRQSVTAPLLQEKDLNLILRINIYFWTNNTIFFCISVQYKLEMKKEGWGGRRAATSEMTEFVQKPNS